MAIRVLLIDDDRKLFELLGRYLEQNDCAVTHALDGGRGLLALEQGGFDLVLLDMMMPGLDGLDTLRRIRAKDSLPVIMLTARGDESDRVVGLELGADDYVPKPFSPRELLARMRAVLRRAHGDVLNHKRWSVGSISVDVDARQAQSNGQDVELTGIEFDILVALMRRAGRVIPREAVLAEAGRTDVVGDRTVDVHISRLRQKLGDDPKSPHLIKTIRGLGYMFMKSP
ncbi:MAG: response regulator transcription factor [Deltaproteobacteria bacterium]|nr:response regulator transcription factor [Deltaproteobacteria bacterium]